MIEKQIIKRARRVLREYKEAKKESDIFLNVFNSGVYVDLAKIRALFIDMADSVLSEFERDLYKIRRKKSNK